MPVHAYRFFSGTCREAMTRYQEVFGGELELSPMSEAPPGDEMPGATPDMIMHAVLTIPDGGVIMASDDPTGDGKPAIGMAMSFNTGDEAEARRAFAALAEGGEVQMPFEPTFWSSGFGVCVDRFGTSWMVNVDAE